MGEEDLKAGIMLVDSDNDVIGYMPFEKDGKDDIGVTWVGKRSINEYKLTNFRAEIQETIRQLDE